MRLSSEFDRMHLKVGQASGRPEGLLRAFLFISLYSVRAERVFCEEIEYNLLYRWFLDMYLMKHSLTQRCSRRTGGVCYNTKGEVRPRLPDEASEPRKSLI